MKEVAPPVSTKVCRNWGSVGAAKDPDKVDEGIVVDGPEGHSDCAIGCVNEEGDETVSKGLALLGRKVVVERPSEGG